MAKCNAVLVVVILTLTAIIICLQEMLIDYFANAVPDKKWVKFKKRDVLLVTFEKAMLLQIYHRLKMCMADSKSSIDARCNDETCFLKSLFAFASIIRHAGIRCRTGCWAIAYYESLVFVCS